MRSPFSKVNEPHASRQDPHSAQGILITQNIRARIYLAHHEAVNASECGGSLESVVDPFYLFRHLSERFPNEPPPEHLDILPKAYVEGKVYILVEFNVAGVGGDYLATFRHRQRAQEGHDQFLWDREGGHYRGLVKSVLNRSSALDTRNQELVLIGDVELMEGPQQVSSTEVRLYEPDTLLVRRTHALYSPHPPILKSRLTVADRENVGFCLAVSADESCGDMVQYGPEIVDSISEDQDKCGGHFINMLDYIIGVAGVWVELRPNRARVGAQKGSPFPLKFLNVRVGVL